MSLRTLKDGTWVVSHDNQVTFNNTQGERVTILLDQIDSAQFDTYSQDPKFPVFRLEKYLARDTDQNLCWMLNTKTPPNAQLIDMIHKDNIADRSMVEVITNAHAIWISKNSGGGIYYSTRISDQKSWQQVLDWDAKGLMNDMYFVEIIASDKSDPTPWIQDVKSHKMLSELDAMPYSPDHQEIRDTACEIPLNKYNSTLTMSSRPVECMIKHHINNILDSDSID
ncbi:MAG: hypothetical protein ACRC5A_11835 [Enterobacteriaceae bacterium]